VALGGGHGLGPLRRPEQPHLARDGQVVVVRSAEPGQLGAHPGHVVGVREFRVAGEDREAALHPGGPGQRGAVRPPAGDPDRQRILHRPGQERRGVHVQLLAVEVDVLAGQQALQHLERLVEEDAALPRLGRVAERAEFLPAVVAEADAHHEPAAGQQVERGRLPGQHPRPAAGERSHHGAEPDLPGGRRDRGHRDPWVTDGHAGARQHVVPEEEPGPPGFLGHDGQVGEPGGIGELIELGEEEPEPNVVQLRLRGVAARIASAAAARQARRGRSHRRP
jgi:hypothetical protein